MCDISETIQKSVQTQERHINHSKKFTSAWSERRWLGTLLWLLPSTLFFAFQLRQPGCWMPRGNAEDNRAHCPWLCVVTSAPGPFTTLMVVQTSGWPSQAHLLWIRQDKWTYDLHPICESPQTCRGLPGQADDFKILWPWSCHSYHTWRSEEARSSDPTGQGCSWHFPLVTDILFFPSFIKKQ